MNRLFLSLEIPEFVLDKIISIRDDIYGSSEKIRWEKKEKLHITLKFFGDKTDFQKNKIIESLSSIDLSNYSEMQLEFNKFGLFYRNRKPVILWCGLKTSENLNNLFSEIELVLEKIDIKKEKRKFKPHLTLLRLRGRENLSKIKNITDYDLNGIKFKPEKIILFNSELKPTGSEYTEVKSFSLINGG